MKKILLTLVFSSIFSSVAIAENVVAEVKVTQEVCDGPFRSKGDLELVQFAINKAKRKVEQKCSAYKAYPAEREVISTFKFNQSREILCIRVEMIDRCLI